MFDEVTIFASETGTVFLELKSILGGQIWLGSSKGSNFDYKEIVVSLSKEQCKGLHNMLGLYIAAIEEGEEKTGW